jgi:hypothetical protein
MHIPLCGHLIENVSQNYNNMLFLTLFFSPLFFCFPLLSIQPSPLPPIRELPSLPGPHPCRGGWRRVDLAVLVTPGGLGCQPGVVLATAKMEWLDDSILLPTTHASARWRPPPTHTRTGVLDGGLLLPAPLRSLLAASSILVIVEQRRDCARVHRRAPHREHVRSAGG